MKKILLTMKEQNRATRVIFRVRLSKVNMTTVNRNYESAHAGFSCLLEQFKLCESDGDIEGMRIALDEMALASAGFEHLTAAVDRLSALVYGGSNAFREVAVRQPMTLLGTSSVSAINSASPDLASSHIRLTAEIAISLQMIYGVPEEWPSELQAAFSVLINNIGYSTMKGAVFSALNLLRIREESSFAYRLISRIVSDHGAYADVVRSVEADIASGIVPEISARAGITFASSPEYIVLPLAVGRVVAGVSSGVITRLANLSGVAESALVALAEATNLVTEAGAFTVAGKGLQEAMGADVDWGIGSIVEEIIASTAVFGALRVGGHLGQELASSINVTSRTALLSKMTIPHFASILSLSLTDEFQEMAGMVDGDASTFPAKIWRSAFLHLVLTAAGEIKEIGGMKDARPRAASPQALQVMEMFLKYLDGLLPKVEGIVPENALAMSGADGGNGVGGGLRDISGSSSPRPLHPLEEILRRKAKSFGKGDKAKENKEGLLERVAGLIGVDIDVLKRSVDYIKRDIELYWQGSREEDVGYAVKMFKSAVMKNPILRETAIYAAIANIAGILGDTRISESGRNAVASVLRDSILEKEVLQALLGEALDVLMGGVSVDDYVGLFVTWTVRPGPAIKYADENLERSEREIEDAVIEKLKVDPESSRSRFRSLRRFLDELWSGRDRFRENMPPLSQPIITVRKAERKVAVKKMLLGLEYVLEDLNGEDRLLVNQAVRNSMQNMDLMHLFYDVAIGLRTPEQMVDIIKGRENILRSLGSEAERIRDVDLYSVLAQIHNVYKTPRQKKQALAELAFMHHWLANGTGKMRSFKRKSREFYFSVSNRRVYGVRYIDIEPSGVRPDNHRLLRSLKRIFLDVPRMRSEECSPCSRILVVYVPPETYRTSLEALQQMVRNELGEDADIRFLPLVQ